MIKFLLIILLSLFTNQIYAQNHFYKIYTGNGYDYGEGVSQSKSDSSYYVTGSSSSFENAPSQAFILHVDTGGTYLWSKSYGGSASDIGKRIFHIPHYGNFVAGFSSSFSNGLFDFYFFKTDTLGKLEWEKTYGGTSNEILHDALQLSDTSFILIGQTTSNETEIEDLFLLRISKNGEIIWKKSFGSPGVDIATTISMIDTNRIIIGGEYFDSDSSKQKALLLSINKEGDINWLKTYGNKNSNYYIKDIYADSAFIRGVGYSQLNSTSDKVYYNMTVDSLGNNYFESYIIQSGNNYFSQIVKYGVFNYNYISMQPTNNPIIPTYSSGEDLIICRYKNDLTWHPKCVNPSNHGDDHCNQLIATNDLGAMSVGYNVYGGKGGSNITLLKIGPYDQFPSGSEAPIENTLVGIKEIKESPFIQLFPNPASYELIINTNSPNTLEMKLMNINGGVLLEQKISNNIKIDVSKFESGVYFIKIDTEIKKIIIEK